MKELYILDIKQIKMVIQRLFLLCVSFLKNVSLSRKREDGIQLGNIHFSFTDNRRGWTISELWLQAPPRSSGK